MSEKLEPTVGAWVHITSRCNQSVAKIDKVTKTHFNCGESRFQMKVGVLGHRKTGSDSFHSTNATVITKERANELKAQFTLKRKAGEAKMFIEDSIKGLSFENAIKVMEYIKSL